MSQSKKVGYVISLLIIIGGFFWGTLSLAQPQLTGYSGIWGLGALLMGFALAFLNSLRK